MTITESDIRRVAALAALDLAGQNLPQLATELDRIVAYVAQLTELSADAHQPVTRPGLSSTPLRPDVVEPARLARSPAELAPEFSDGLFVVPRLAAMEDG